MELDPKFQELLNEYNDLNASMLNEEIMRDHQKLEKISKRLRKISAASEKINKLKSTIDSINGSNDLLNDSNSSSDIKELAQMEIDELTPQIEPLKAEIDELLFEEDPDNDRNAIVEIRAGTGGDEAALFASDLFRMYSRYSETQGWKMEILNSNYTGNGGFKEIIFMLSGDGVYGKLKFESGVHRVQRVPVTESSGRIHTSAASVVVLPEIDDVEVEVNEQDLKIDVYRSSGPGGQSVNTTDSAVRITHIPTGIVVTCQDEKSQHKNKARAISVLKSKLYELELEKQSAETSNLRKTSISTGDRSAKIRTYNFPESRVTDHRIKKTWHNLQMILDGNLEDVIEETQKGLTALS